MTYLEFGCILGSDSKLISNLVSVNETKINHFNIQLMHTTLKNIGLLKHFKTSKTAPTCFGL